MSSERLNSRDVQDRIKWKRIRTKWKLGDSCNSDTTC